MQRIPHPKPLPLSRAVIAGPFVFLSGQLAMNAQGEIEGEDIATQTRLTLEGVAETLKLCGARMTDVVRSTVWLTDLKNFAAFNEEYRKHFPEGFPARSTVQAGLYPGALVEIEVQALLPAS